jgi:hypothetical protein
MNGLPLPVNIPRSIAARPKPMMPPGHPCGGRITRHVGDDHGLIIHEAQGHLGSPGEPQPRTTFLGQQALAKSRMGDDTNPSGGASPGGNNGVPEHETSAILGRATGRNRAHNRKRP